MRSHVKRGQAGRTFAAGLQNAALLSFLLFLVTLVVGLTLRGAGGHQDHTQHSQGANSEAHIC